ncbi:MULTISPECIES: phage tail tape measure protein [unclassified Acinetobacter]|uniref:phage tail tape measure protein n=1 Tax=unclassified Acinetobacter TaxID=196816 RepID=UPI0015D24446|nr:MULTISPECIES: phage tail tape measure protein [unclassified Acinetobacter]
MSTKLGTLTLDLVAKIGNFTGPIKDAEKQTKLSFDNMRNHVNNYGAVAVAGAAAVGAGVFAMANEYANAARELQIFASISNTTTQEFQRMAVGAKTMGISQEQLADQLKDFNEKLGEFITIGSGGAVDFFEQIAIKTEGSAEGARKLALEMQNLSGPKALQLYVDKLEEAGATQQQMSFYLESMASDTTNLIPLLRDGGKGFEYWADAAERAGVIMDESAIAKANELKVQMELLGLQVDGAKNKFIQGLMPALVSVGDGMSNAATETNLMSDAGETLGEVFKGVAATGMGVYAVVKMLSNAIAGLAFDAVNAKKTVDLAAEKGTWADKLPGVKFAKTAIFGVTMAKAPNSGVAMAAKDNAKVADDVASSIGRIYSNAVNQSVSAMAKIQGSQAGVTKGSDEWIKKQNEASKSAAKNSKANSDAAKALREYNRSVELGKRLIYEYGDEQLRIAEDLRKDLDEIQSASLKPEAKDRYAAVARMQADARKKAYIAELDSELNEHKATEEEKLKTELNINKLRLDGQRGLNENELKLRKQALDEQYAYQKRTLEISQAKELLQTKQLWMSAGEYAQEYYALVREEILNTPSYSPEMKDALIQQANYQQSTEQAGESDQAIADYRDVMGYEESPLIKQYEVLDKMRKLDLINEEKYQQDKLKLQALSTASYMEGMIGGFASLVDENSKTYAVLFAAQKAFAVAQAMLNIPAAYSKAYDAVVGTPYIGPYIAPAVGAAAAALQVAQAASIKGVGYADGGFTGYGGKYEPAGIVHKGEGVLTQEEIAALGGPSGFYALRDSIRNGFADGGLVMDAPKVLNPSQNPEVKKAMDQVQSNTGQPQVNLNPNFVIVDEREKLGDYLFGSDGKKAFVKFFKQNRRELGIA